jgi:hypothetical protein
MAVVIREAVAAVVCNALHTANRGQSFSVPRSAPRNGVLRLCPIV